MTLAGVCLIVAGVLFLKQRLDGAFVMATLAVVAWFLSYRVRMKRIIAADTQTNTRGEDSDEFDD